MIATSFLGAYFVVRISGERRRSESLLHGAISWGLSMLLGAAIALFAAGAAANTATPSTRAKIIITGNGSVAPNLTRGERVRAAETKSEAARGAGLAGGGAALALIFSLFGALFAASRSSGISIAEELRVRSHQQSGKAPAPHAPGSPARLDETTILPPTH